MKNIWINIKTNKNTPKCESLLQYSKGVSSFLITVNRDRSFLITVNRDRSFLITVNREISFLIIGKGDNTLHKDS